MEIRKIEIKTNTGAAAQLVAYLQTPSEYIEISRSRKAVIVCPGGAYSILADHEGEPVALSFASAGAQAFVLNYSVAPAAYPDALCELALALAYVKDHARELYVDPDEVFVCGFSAGGHLCGCLGTLWNDRELSAVCGRDAGDIRPAGMILCYPVITLGELTHAESRRNLLGENPDAALVRKLSLENSVSADTVPAFIWTTAEDGSVPPRNSLMLATALSACGVQFELHVYENGSHGNSLCTRASAPSAEAVVPEASGWFAAAVRWLWRH